MFDLVASKDNMLKNSTANDTKMNTSIGDN